MTGYAATLGYHGLESAPEETGARALAVAEECLLRESQFTGAAVVAFAENANPLAPVLADARQRYEMGEQPDPRAAFSETAVEVKPTIDRGTTVCQEAFQETAGRLFRGPGEYAVFLFYQADSDRHGGAGPEILEGDMRGLGTYDPGNNNPQERLSLDTLRDRIDEAQEAAADDQWSYTRETYTGRALAVAVGAATVGLLVSWARARSIGLPGNGVH